MDTLPNTDDESLQGRVLHLEKKVQQQDDEIICLKSALADAIRRLSAIEIGQKTGSTSYKAPVRPSNSVQTPVTPSRPQPPGNSFSSSSSNSRDGSSPAVRQSSSNLASTPNSVQPSSPGFSKPAPMRSAASTLSQPAAASATVAKKRPSVGGDANGTVAASSQMLTSTENIPAVQSFNASIRQVSGSLSSLTNATTDRPFLLATPSRSQKETSYNAADGCIRFFMRGRGVNFYVPTSLMPEFQITLPSQPPKEKLALEWVYGYRGRDARSNIYQLPTGEIVYFVAAVAVLYNVEEQMQRHYLGHTDDIKCMAVHPDKVTIATGQVAGHDKTEGKMPGSRRRESSLLDVSDSMAHIRIWNSISLNTLKVIGLGLFDRAIACVAFSKADNGQFLVAVDESNEHVLSVWDWQKGDKGQRITEVKSSTEPVVSIEFHPCEATSFMTCGKSQISFWTLESGSVSRKQGVFEKHDKPKFVTCLAFAENGDLLTGDSNGTLFVWARGTNKISQSVTGAHEGGIFSICILKDGSVVTGGKDRRLVQWNSSYKKSGLEVELTEAQGAVRMISQGKGNLLLIGTTKNIILQGSFDLKFSPIMQGHVDELWGLAVCPSQNQFVTVGYDKLLYLWDTLTHGTIWCKELPDGGQTVCVHPEGQIIIVSGASSSRWLVIDVTSREVIESHSDAAERIDCIEYSPDAKFLACGSRDNNIYIYSVSEGGRKYSKIAKLSGHSSFVTHLDWSVDGQYIQSNSGDYELLYWSAATWRQVTSSSQLRDVEWATQNCTLAFSAYGIWPEGADGTDINGCCRSVRHHLLASADDFGKVNLYNYPCNVARAVGHSYRGHSSHVTTVRFLCDDSRLLSLGGKDSAILQWQVVDGAY